MTERRHAKSRRRRSIRVSLRKHYYLSRSYLVGCSKLLQAEERSLRGTTSSDPELRGIFHLSSTLYRFTPDFPLLFSHFWQRKRILSFSPSFSFVSHERDEKRETKEPVIDGENPTKFVARLSIIDDIRWPLDTGKHYHKAYDTDRCTLLPRVLFSFHIPIFILGIFDSSFSFFSHGRRLCASSNLSHTYYIFENGSTYS